MASYRACRSKEIDWVESRRSESRRSRTQSVEVAVALRCILSSRRSVLLERENGIWSRLLEVVVVLYCFIE